MDDTKGQVIDSAARIYEEFFVPALFEEWAPRVADKLGARSGAAALDVACGTGALARELAGRIGPERVVGLDCNPGMLAVAREKAPRIDWREGRAEALPFESGRFDAVACQFGLMFFDDRAAALAEMWRVLAPGGHLAVAVWGALDATPGYAAVVQLLERLFGADVAAELRAPFCLGDLSVLCAPFAAAGLPVPNVQTIVGQAHFPSIEAWVRTDVRGWTLADRIDDQQYRRLADEAQSALRQFAVDGAVRFDSPAHIAHLHKP